MAHASSHCSTPALPLLEKGRFRARLAAGPADVQAAQDLRGQCFLGGGRDGDRFDPLCDHLLIEERKTGALLACCRLMALSDGGEIDRSYCAQFYNLDALRQFPGRMAEIGRFCIRPDQPDPDILRIAWGALAHHVDETGVQMLFGCASFQGTDPGAYEDAFAMLRAHHLAPERWQPRIKAPDVVRFASRPLQAPDRREALRRMPPLLKTYLTMGGWVSDHAVVDGQLNTLHVFTGVEVAMIPPARKRLLRAVAQ